MMARKRPLLFCRDESFPRAPDVLNKIFRLLHFDQDRRCAPYRGQKNQARARSDEFQSAARESLNYFFKEPDSSPEISLWAVSDARHIEIVVMAAMPIRYMEIGQDRPVSASSLVAMSGDKPPARTDAS